MQGSPRNKRWFKIGFVGWVTNTGLALATCAYMSKYLKYTSLRNL